MEAISVLWIQSRQAVEANPLPPAPLGWKIDLFVSGGGHPELGFAGYTAVLLDFSAGYWAAERLLEQLRSASPSPIVIVYDPHSTIGTSHAHADARVSSLASVYPRIAQAVEGRRTDSLAVLAGRVAQGDAEPRQEWERLLVGESHSMRQVGHLIRMVGGRRATVLITGETGSGKEVAARALHMAGDRRRGPLVSINCGALPENLLEAELFGHVRGAFTGATQGRIGRFESAQGGTLFLDEIGEMPLDLQVKLLRALQEREIQRLGSSDTIRLDVRVVAATNCDLRQRMEEGRFREDLYYRLNVVPIHMPPLRSRREDIPSLAVHFARKTCAAERIPLKSFTVEALDHLCSYTWPGNVRQLENAVEMAIILSGERISLDVGDFPLPETRPRSPSAGELPLVALPEGGLDYEHTLALIERSILDQALRKTGGNKKAAAQMLRLKRTTLAAKVRSLESLAMRN